MCFCQYTTILTYQGPLQQKRPACYLLSRPEGWGALCPKQPHHPPTAKFLPPTETVRGSPISLLGPTRTAFCQPSERTLIKPVQVTEYAFKLNTTLYFWAPDPSSDKINNQLGEPALSQGGFSGPTQSLTFLRLAHYKGSYHDVGGHNCRIITHRLNEKHLGRSKTETLRNNKCGNTKGQLWYHCDVTTTLEQKGPHS